MSFWRRSWVVQEKGLERGCKRSGKEMTSRSWPGFSATHEASNPKSSLQSSTEDAGAVQSSCCLTDISSILFVPRESQLLRRPPPCRLPSSLRFTTLTLYIFLTILFISTASAAPLHPPTHFHLQIRQAIPDRFNNTGNEPAPASPSLSKPPLPLPTSPTATATSAATSTSTSTSTSAATPTLTSEPSTITVIPLPSQTAPSAAPTIPPTSPSGNTNSGSTESDPLPPDLLKLKLIDGEMSRGALAGLIAGSTLAFISLLGLAIFLLRRRRRPSIAEIPIRRSTLGSMLRYRIFGSQVPPAERAGSRASRGSNALTGDGEQRFLRKESIGKPEPRRWGEGGLLGVPRPAFLKGAGEVEESGEKGGWVNKGMISAPRPGRPASAEPLGRLSGMGMGMGYQK